MWPPVVPQQQTITCVREMTCCCWTTHLHALCLVGCQLQGIHQGIAGLHSLAAALAGRQELALGRLVPLLLPHLVAHSLRMW